MEKEITKFKVIALLFVAIFGIITMIVCLFGFWNSPVPLFISTLFLLPANIGIEISLIKAWFKLKTLA
jgi:ABC-type multidrug transport system permease subunit